MRRTGSHVHPPRYVHEQASSFPRSSPRVSLFFFLAVVLSLPTSLFLFWSIISPSSEPRAPSSTVQQSGGQGPTLRRSIETLTNAAFSRTKGKTVDDRLYVFLDFNHPRSQFGRQHYSALESILAWHPQAVVRVLVYAPELYVNYHFANVLGKTHFRKYSKRGYDVDVLLVNSGSTFASANSSSRGASPPPGLSWWKKQAAKYCPEKVEPKSYFKIQSALQPLLPVLAYSRLALLYTHGGVYTDFSVLWTNATPQHSFWDDAGCGVREGGGGAGHGHMVMRFERQDPVIACALSAMEEEAAGPFRACVEKSEVEGSDCLRDLMKRCIRTVGGGRVTEGGVVHWGGCKPEEKEEKQDLLSSSSAVWMGDHYGGSHAWDSPAAGSLLHSALQSLPLLQRPQLSCGEGPPACTFLPHSHICAPTLFIPGTQKGASSFLFHAINRHPQVLQPLVGSQYKEPGVYIPTRYSSSTTNKAYEGRTSYFPYIAPDEPLLSSEGTVTYMYQDGAAELIRGDNPNARVIFTLRDPVARAWSDYRFNYHGYYKDKEWGSFREVVEAGMQEVRDCLKREEIKSNPMLFYDCPSRDAHKVVARSIYHPSLQHWMRVFSSPPQLLVVTTEDLARDEEDVLSKVVSFLGLCPFDFGQLHPDHVTEVRHPRTKDMVLDPQLEQEMRRFFQPFNKQLYHLVGRDLGWEAETVESGSVKRRTASHAR